MRTVSLRHLNDCIPVLAIGLLLLSVASSAARVTPSDHYDALPLQTTRSVRFTTNEGTWLDLDLSPDGRTILFELLGDLYTLPITGGKAVRITNGSAYDSQPRFSPDGGSIAFVSDRDGGDNIWLANVDGTDPRMMTHGKTNYFRSLEWTPDGYIVASKGKMYDGVPPSPFPSRNYSVSRFPIMLYDPRGGNGFTLDLKNVVMVAAPAFGSEPRYMYASVLRDSNPDWTIIKFDRETGLAREVGVQGRAVLSVVSPDNTWLIYGSRYENGMGLRLRNLQTGEERWLVKDVQRDAGLAASSRGLMPGSAFTPDGRAVVLYNKGKIWRVEVPSGKAVEIPFVVDVDIPVAPLVRFEYRIQEERDLTAIQIRGACPSPDGKRLIFTALNKLWLVDLPRGIPHRLTTDVDIGEHQPAWSPDGRYIAYASWREGGPTETSGGLRRVAVPSTAEPARSEQLTHDHAYYDHPVYAPDGSRIAANRELLSTRLARLEEATHDRRVLEDLSSSSELIWIPSQGGKTTQIISPAAGIPMVTRDGSRIWLNRRSQLESLRWDGTDRVTILTVPEAAELLIAPNEKQVLALAPRFGDIQAYLVGLPGVSGITVNLAYPDSVPVPVKKLTTVGVSFPGWAADGAAFYYSVGRVFFAVDVSNELSMETSKTEIALRVPVDQPQGTIALRGARIVTMGQKGTIEKGDLVVTSNRITAIGKQGEVAIPRDARTIDVTGKTIIPGFIDTHGHLYDPAGSVDRDAILHNHWWPYLAALAYGVTTNRDPGGSIDEFSYADMVAAGRMLGPRIYSTGPHITDYFNISSYEDARRLTELYGDLFGTRYIKQYASGERQVRQWLNMAAAQEQLTADAETADDPKKALIDAMDGYAELAHGIPMFPLYKDVIQLLAQTRISYTATLTVLHPPSDSEARGDGYFYTRENIAGDTKLQRFMPRRIIDKVAFRLDAWYADGEYSFPSFAADIKTMIDAGVNVAIGSHGNLKGLGYGWELEMHAAGGIGPGDILRAATTSGARTIGLERDVGSLDDGKLADLQVLDHDPVRNIRNVRSLRYVMKGGRLYDGDTLDEIWPSKRKLPSMWWQ